MAANYVLEAFQKQMSPRKPIKCPGATHIAQSYLMSKARREVNTKSEKKKNKQSTWLHTVYMDNVYTLGIGLDACD